ncbi:TPA: hypothetical protein N0F65_000609 [Lagenidium giganteum]|uniref:Presenilin n=1 Tax=Lagenidium giganteum TaxID=4803 RepID=A0AAV2YNX5_9STRA|nr:TPA: hypothetical protein N0F65_000609 [Lagenidium giganteum]
MVKEKLTQEDDPHVLIGVNGGAPEAAAGYDKLTTPMGGANVEAASASAAATQAQNANAAQSTQEQEDASDDLMHGINSFWAIVYPVCLTMIVASLVVVNYRSSNIEASMSTYLVYGESSQKSGVQQFGMSLVNALVIIGGIAVLTFGMALLYKFNCMKFLTGYIMFASTAILSFVGGQLVDSVINDQLHWVVDWPSFLFVMVNFGVVGVISIFYQKGISKIIQNGYLVMVSVILAWEFSMWPMWTTFIFCVMFAFYDLCAVLTPCGPLKCLIGLIQEKQAPLPGLLYEADVQDGTSNQPRRKKEPPASQVAATAAAASIASNAPQAVPQAAPRNGSGGSAGSVSKTVRTASSGSSSPSSVAPPQQPRPRNVMESNFAPYPCETMEALVELLSEFYSTFSPEDTWKAPQVAEKFFPTQERLWTLIYHKYKVCTCSIEVPCPVQERQDARRQAAEEDEDDKTIKLGLGDFIFYSVLVGRAAMYDFSTFVVAFLCIVMGLGGTLFLLSVLHKALPALPISIFLATGFYFWTQFLFTDFCTFVMQYAAVL